MATTETDYSAVDLDALHRAMAQAMKEPERRRQILSMVENSGWSYAAEFAANLCQSAALQLKPWETPPACCDESDAMAWALADRLIAAGLSQFEPDPLAALARQAKARK
jgi:hypothetical protein